MRIRITIAVIIFAACCHVGTMSDEDVDALPPLAAGEEMRIGDVDDPDVGFSRIGGVDVDRDGNIFVVEAAVPEIRVYGPDGTMLRRIGRRGSGPGEFEGAPRFGVIGDTVWAVESRGFSRITLFDRMGTVLATGRTEGVKVPLPTSIGYVRPQFMRPDGRFTSHFSMVSFGRDDAPGGVKPTDSIPVPHVLFDASGQVTDTVGWAGRPPPRMWRPPSQEVGVPQRLEVGGRPMYVPGAPSTLPFWEPLPDGHLLVETPLAEREGEGVMSVTRFGLTGDTIFVRKLRYRPVRWSAEDLDSIAARAARGELGGMAPLAMRGGGSPPVPDNWPGIAARLRGAMNFPEFKLPIDIAWVAQDESIWLRRRAEEGAPARWILLDARGRPRGELELPSRVRVVWHHGDAFWAVVPDEFDVQWLVRYRMR